MYKHEVILSINYMTYDLRCVQDLINMPTHPYLMTLGHEDQEEGTKWHPYWYAKVLGIFHVNMRRWGVSRPSAWTSSGSIGSDATQIMKAALRLVVQAVLRAVLCSSS